MIPTALFVVLPAFPPFPVQRTPCRGPYALSLYTTRRYTSGLSGNKAPDLSGAVGRSDDQGVRSHRPTCVVWRWMIRNGASSASRSRKQDTSDKTWQLLASSQCRCHIPHPGVPHSCSQGPEGPVGKSLSFWGMKMNGVRTEGGVDWASCWRWPCTEDTCTVQCGLHDPSRSWYRQSRKCDRMGWRQAPWDLPCRGNRGPGQATWLNPQSSHRRKCAPVCDTGKVSLKCHHSMLYTVNREGG